MGKLDVLLGWVYLSLAFFVMLSGWTPSPNTVAGIAFLAAALGIRSMWRK